MDGFDITAGMAGNFLRAQENDNFEEFATSMAQSYSLVAECRLVDPTGDYHIITKPLTYEIPGVPPEQLVGAREFVRISFFPSSHLNMWNKSRRVMQMDCGHMRGRIKGVFQAVSTQDANNQNFYVGFVINTAENKKNYDDMFDVLNVILVMTILVLITDKFQGLKSIIATTNSAASASAADGQSAEAASLERQKDVAEMEAQTLLGLYEQAQGRYHGAIRNRADEMTKIRLKARLV